MIQLNHTGGSVTYEENITKYNYMYFDVNYNC